nr:hypothetical protein Iba_chr11dCG9520 [Ipomoea batatas]
MFPETVGGRSEEGCDKTPLLTVETTLFLGQFVRPTARQAFLRMRFRPCNLEEIKEMFTEGLDSNALKWVR